MKLKFVILLLFILLVPLVSGLNSIVKQNTSYNLRVTPTFNGSISSITTNITVNDPDGIVLVPFQVMTKNTNSQDFNYTIPASNLTKLGFYDCTFFAFSTATTSQAFSCSFEVNPSGKEYIPQISGPLIFGAILTLMFISSFLLILAGKIELFPMKVFLMILSGIIAIVNLGFVTGSFQEFYSTGSALSGVFGTLYITFVILLTGASIFVIIWLLLEAVKLYKIKRGFFIEE